MSARTSKQLELIAEETLVKRIAPEPSASNPSRAAAIKLPVIDVSEISDWQHERETGDDWMGRLLKSRAFVHIPSSQLQAMFMRLEERPARAGEVIVRQGDAGDAYYIVRRGRCSVWRRSPTGANVQLATLLEGDTFGEEALLSGEGRNATVTMETDGLLMRLSRRDFDQLLGAPRLRMVDLEEARRMVAAGARLLDVRTERRNDGCEIPGAEHIPLFVLRIRLENLDRNAKYICVCDTGQMSSVAAFLLCERDFESYVLKGGLGSIPRIEP